MINRSVAPTFKSLETFHLLRPEEIKLDNGIQLFSFNGGEQELVRIEWVFNNIAWKDRVPLLNVALSGMLLEGTTHLSGAELAEQVDFYGAFLQPEYAFDHLSLTLYTLNKHIGKLLPLIKDVLQNSIFPEKEFQTYCRNNKQTLSVSLKKNDFVARRLFNQAIFSSTRYGYSPEIADYDAIERADLQGLYQQQIRPENCLIFIGGRVDTTVIEAINHEFGQDSWGRNAADIAKNKVEPYSFDAISTALIYEPKEASLQSAIRIGTRTIDRKHPDFSYLWIANTLLGGYFGSRLMSNIREDKGYTYGIGSGIGTLKHSAFFTIATEVGADVTSATLDEIAKEMKRLREEMVSVEELEVVKNYLRGTFVGSLENVFSHVDKFKRLYLADVDVNYYQRHFEIIKKCTPSDVLETANKYLNDEDMAKVVVGKGISSKKGQG